jgi:hypothetical protein
LIRRPEPAYASSALSTSTIEVEADTEDEAGELVERMEIARLLKNTPDIMEPL